MAGSLYTGKSLIQLIRLIEGNRDKLALAELMKNRKVIYYKNARMIFPEFAQTLRDRGRAQSELPGELVDRTYDLLVDKFTNMPKIDDRPEHQVSLPLSKRNRRGVDCRHYYKAILVLFDDWKKANPSADEISEELAACEILQKMVIKHYYLSLKECRRAMMPFARRYFWKVNNGSITLRCPVEISGSEFRKWLEENIPDPQPNRSGEAERIQARVDAYFARGSFVTYDEAQLSQAMIDDYSPNAEELAKDKSGLSKLSIAVAKEKAANIDTMRPAIRKLGEKMLYALVQRVFNDIEDGVLEDTRIAGDFGISKATFSRFAGSDWNQKIGDKNATIPDLWLNTAHVLASDPNFMQVAQSAGVLPQVKKVLETGGIKHV